MPGTPGLPACSGFGMLLEKHFWRNVEAPAQFFDVRFCQIAFSIEDFGNDALGTEDVNQINLA